MSILGKSKEAWIQEFPLLEKVTNLKEAVYINETIDNTPNHTITSELSLADIEDQASV